MRASLSRSDTANQAGETERTAAFRRLAEQALGPSFRLANAILGDPAEAEDAVAAPDPAASVDQRILLEQALGRLDADDQVLIVLRYDHDLMLDDIAHSNQRPGSRPSRGRPPVPQGAGFHSSRTACHGLAPSA